MTVPAARRSVDGEYDRGIMLATVRRATDCRQIRIRSGTISESVRLVRGARCRNHRHEDRISCCNCDSCRWCRTGGPFCWLAAARKSVHACRRPISDRAGRIRGSVFAWIRSAEARARRYLAARRARSAGTPLPHIPSRPYIHPFLVGRIECENSSAASGYTVTPSIHGTFRSAPPGRQRPI